MKILIPMAGLGTRLRPHTWSKPKPLLQVAGKTVLAHLLDSFKTLPDPDNIELVFIIGYLGDQVPKYMAEYYPQVKAHYVTQSEMKGQSQALHLAAKFLQGPVMVVFADTLADTDFSMVGKEDLDGYAWVKSVPDPRRFGVAEVDPSGFITGFVEKPVAMDNNRAVIGLYYYRQGEQLLAAIEEQMAGGKTLKGEYYLTDATTIMVHHGARMKPVEVGVWLDAGTTEAILETNRHLLDKQRPMPTGITYGEDVTILQPVSIHRDVKLAHCTIGPYTSISHGCIIAGSHLEDCIIDSNSQITNSSLTHSLIGRHVHVDGISGSVDLGDHSRVVCP